jgi:hypothetical protein
MRFEASKTPKQQREARKLNDKKQSPEDADDSL